MFASYGLPLQGVVVSAGDPAPATRLAGRLLEDLGATVTDARQAPPRSMQLAQAGRDALAAWAGSGGAWLTGHAGGPPLGGPAPVAEAMDAAATALRGLAGWAGVRLDVDGPLLLGQRAALRRLSRAGPVSAGGTCRYLEAADGWIAANLPRDDDWAMVPAWLGAGVQDWPGIARATGRRAATTLVERAQMLGMPVALVTTPAAAMRDAQARARGQGWPPSPWLLDGRPARRARDGATGPRGRRGSSRPPARTGSPLVVDLSSLWAGPLATRLLADAGARVVTVESRSRPGAGPPDAFHTWLHAGKRPVSLDFRSRDGRTVLRRLLCDADIVIEGSRPRALDQLGCGPGALLGRHREQVWVSITGYGRTGPQRQWAALGDDAGAAGGLAVRDAGRRLFCGDALADPATGLHAALAALACWHGGGTHHVDIAMREVAARVAAGHPDGLQAAPRAERHGGRWWFGAVEVRAPSAAGARAQTPGRQVRARTALADAAGGSP